MMKKLLTICVITTILAACSMPNGRSKPQEGNMQIEEALKACQQAMTSNSTREDFDACMLKKGFERPANKNQPKAN
ncbi:MULTISPECIES: hypothetical protein [Basfia]|nr:MULTISPECIES: hypothetical protein [Basfia]QIM69493.1 hypothetical protein A4G13_08880 [Basfia succiniciproducens]